MDRCAVFVDAGYLHESAKTLMTAGHPGSTVRGNPNALVREIAALAVTQTQLPLLRIYWYAAAPNRNPYPDQRELASLGDIKLRLGNLRERPDGRRVQKGVDAELHADMTVLARNRGAVDFVLLSGDEDLLRAVDEVQTYGVRVHLWGVEAGPDGGNQSLELIAAADRRHVLEEAWIRGVFTLHEPPKLDSPTQRPRAALNAQVIAVGAPSPGLPGSVASPGLPAPELPAPGLPAPPGVPASAGSIGPAGGPADPPGETQVSPGSAAAGAGAGGTAGDLAAGDPTAGGANADGVTSGALTSGTDSPGAETATSPTTPGATPTLGQAGASPGQGSGAVVPKPTDLRPRPARPATTGTIGGGAPPADTLLYTTSGQNSGYSPAPDYAFYRLSDLTTQAEQDADTTEDATTAFDAITVGRTYARRWLGRATPEAAAMLAAEHPTIPRAIDSELLRYAVARGVDTWSGETDKFAVRQGFWSAMRAAQGPSRAASGATPAPADA